MATANLLEVSLSFKPILDGLNQFVSAIQDRMKKVDEFNAKIANGAQAVNDILGKAAAVIGVEKFGEFVAEAQRAQAAQQQLAQSMANAGVYSDDYAEELQKQAEALERVTNFKETEIVTTQRQLIAYGATRDQLRQLVPLVLDFAAKNNMDPGSAALLIGKTLQGQEVGLGRLGIVLDGTKDKYTSLVEQMSRLASGQAQAAVAFPALHELGVDLEHARIAAGRLIEAVVRPIFEPMANSARAARAELEGLKKWFESLGPLAKSAIAGTADELTYWGSKILGVVAIVLLVKAAWSGVLLLANPLRSMFVMLTGMSFTALVNDVQAFSKALGIVQTMNLATWSQRFATFGVVVAAAFAGYAIGNFINQLQAGGMTIGDWTARAANLFLGWAELVGGAFQLAWVFLKFNFLEMLPEGRIMILEFTEFVIEKLNIVLGKLGKKIPTDGFKDAIAAYKKEVGTLDAEKSAAYAAVEARLKAGMDFRSGVDEDLAAKGRAGVAGAPAAAGPANNPNPAGAPGAPRDQTLEKEIAQTQAQLDAENAVTAALLAGDQALADRLLRTQEELKLRKELKVDEDTDAASKQRSLGIIKTKVDLDAAEALKKRKAQEDERALSEQLGKLEIQRADIEKDWRLTDEEKQALTNDLLAKENVLIAARIALKESELKKGLNTQDAADAQKEIDRLEKQLAENQRAKSAEPVGIQQGAMAATIEWLTSIGTVAKRVGNIMSSTIGAAVTGISSSIVGLINRTMTWGQALANIGTTIIQSVIQAFAQMVAQWIVKQIVMAVAGDAIRAAGVAAAAAQAASLVLIWGPAAMAASIATFGSADAIGASAYESAMLSSFIPLATGGDARKGGSYIVGDAGRPEIFVPDENGYVFPSVGEGLANLAARTTASMARPLTSTGGPAGGRSGGNAGGGAPDAPEFNHTTIVAFSAADVAREQRKYMRAEVERGQIKQSYRRT